MGGGRAVPVQVDGPRDGPVLLSLPGLSDGVAPLGVLDPPPPPPPSLAGLRCVRTSYLPGPDRGTDGFADDVAAAVDGLLDGPIHVVGHSTGGMVALHLAARHPELVASLVVVATASTCPPVLADHLDRWDAMVRAGDVAGYLQDANDAATSPHHRDTAVAQLSEAVPPTAPDAVQRHLALSAAVRDHDASEALGAVAAPVTCVVGALDRVVPPDAVRDLALALPRADLEVWDGYGHALPDHAGDRLAALLRAVAGGSRR